MTALALSEHQRDDRSRAAPGQFSGYVERTETGLARLSLLVEGAHCGACIRRIEDGLMRDARVEGARLNLSTRRLEITWRGANAESDAFVALVEGLGYRATPYLPEALADRDDVLEKALLRALAVAFFATFNVMMLSWAVWIGHAGSMLEGTRGLFHWLSALIALPAIAYAGRPFFASAWAVLRKRRTNMDVPISLGVLLTAGMSLAETIRGGPHVYFDGALSLLFVLLVGRYLDQRSRAAARSAVQRLAQIGSRPVQLLHEDGRLEPIPPARIRPGQSILVAAGETIGVDGIVTAGRSSIDRSLLDGEAVPAAIGPGDAVFAGTVNLGQPLTVRTRAAGRATVLAEIIRLLEAAEQKKGRYVALADRVVRWYTPVIHGLAAATFMGWLLLGDAGWQLALVHAVSVLIIACPCALGLAVPVTQVVAAGVLMRHGILLKSETALERLATVDTVIFDKTGTLTLGEPRLITEGVDPAVLALASGLAASSSHPLARALREAAPLAPVLTDLREMPGAGLSWVGPEGEVRLGSAAFCDCTQADDMQAGNRVWLARPGMVPVMFSFVDPLRGDAASVIAGLRGSGYRLGLLSGDRDGAVRIIAGQLGLDGQAEASPAQKLARLDALRGEGRRVLMVGDGLNDAPALAAAHASLAPTSALDISRRAADAIWQGRGLSAVITLLKVARKSRAIVLQNIGFSFLYNAAWVPVAMAGLVTPWIAALAMSASSLLVTLNALRLGRSRFGDA